MSTTIKSMILSFILVVIAALLYHFTFELDRNTDAIVDTLPAFESSNFSGRSFTKDGDLKYEFKSSRVVFYKKDQIVDVQKPNIIYYEKLDDNSFRTYELNADIGTIKLNSFAILKGNIHLVPNFKDSFINSIRTDNLRYDLNKGVISSPDYIEITGPNFKNSGFNFKIDLNNKQFRIAEAPHATYFHVQN